MIFTIRDPKNPEQKVTYNSNEIIHVTDDRDLKKLDQILEHISSRPAKPKVK